MSIIMSYIDYNSAGIGDRERFSLTTEECEPIYREILKNETIEGAVLIATCNRTELYLSTAEQKEVHPAEVLCDSMDIKFNKYFQLFRTLKEDDCIRHLCRVASGAESQLWGDSQIISQVRESIRYARKFHASDAQLNVLFRNAISCGKKIKSNVDLHIHDASTIHQACFRIKEDPGIQRVLVIGNGTIGRSVAANLAQMGYDSTMTLRHYHHVDTIVPHGVSVVNYDDRYQAMEHCDAVICATASPHFVVKREELEKLSHVPGLFIDMAVPRDVEPSVTDMPGLVCENIDDISKGHDKELKQQQQEIVDRYIDKYIDDYHHWNDYREYIQCDRKYFPVFVNSEGMDVVVAGGGTVAERRILTLLNFQFDITVVAPEITGTIQEHVDKGELIWIKKEYSSKYIEDADIVLACTNNHHVNKTIGEDAARSNIWFNMCDNRHESQFWFPAIAMNDELTVGIIGNGKKHGLVRRIAARFREIIERKAYN